MVSSLLVNRSKCEKSQKEGNFALFYFLYKTLAKRTPRTNNVNTLYHLFYKVNFLDSFYCNKSSTYFSMFGNVEAIFNTCFSATEAWKDWRKNRIH